MWPAGQVVAGETMGRWAIALFQGAYIMLASRLLFGVSWGNVWLSLLVVLVFSLVAAGAAILLGTLLGNEGAASGAGVGVGLVLAALGGSMLPLELFPDTIRAFADLTPRECDRVARTVIEVIGEGDDGKSTGASLAPVDLEGFHEGDLLRGVEVNRQVLEILRQDGLEDYGG